jgi:hypothetical protein
MAVISSHNTLHQWMAYDIAGGEKGRADAFNIL